MASNKEVEQFVEERIEPLPPTPPEPAALGGPGEPGEPGGGGGSGPPPSTPQQPGEAAQPSQSPAEIFGDLIGRFKRYQLMVFVLCASGKLATAMNMFAITYFAPVHEYTCASGKKNYCPCTNPKFDYSVFKNTIISEWLLICENKVYKSYIQSILHFGAFIGSYLFGAIADRWGRRPSLISASVIQMAASITAAFAPNVWVFMLHRFIVGLSTGGAIVVGFICMNEILHPKDRDVVAPCFFLSFNFFGILVPCIAYFIRDWRKLQIFIGCTSFVQIPMLCFLPESPRWLIAEENYEKAIVIIEKLRKCNKQPFDTVREDVMKLHGPGEKAKAVKCVDLCLHARMRRYFIIMCINFFAVSYFYYGVSQFVGRIAGDIYFQTIFNSAATFVAVCFGIPLMYTMKRRTLLVFLFLLSFVSLCIMGLINSIIVNVLLVTISTITDFTAFNLLYMYASELYPTVIRSTAMGMSSASARIGSMIAPVTVEMDNKALRPFMFAMPALIAAVASIFLDETKGHELPATVEELERQHNKQK